MKKRVVTWILMGAMMAGLAGCGSTGGQESTGTPTQSVSQEAESKEEAKESTQAESTGTEEAVPVMLFQGSTRRTDEDNEMVHDAIMEQTGLDLQLNYVSEDANQKYALLVAGGTVPDISVISKDMYLEYAAQGAYYDITDLVEKYPNLMAYVPEDFWDRVKVDGRIYGIPTKNTEGKYNLYYRKDWLDNLGLDIATDKDSYTEILRAFTEDDPDGNGQNDTYGYGNKEFRIFYAMYGIMPGYYHEVGNEVVIDAISNEYKECLQYIHDLYAAGYIDPEVFTDTEDQYKQKVNTGKCGSFTQWWTHSAQFVRDWGFKESQPDGELIAADLPVDASKGQGMAASDALSGMICFSYEDGEIIEKLLNYVDWISSDEGYRTCKYGIEGLHWSMEDGKLTYLSGWDPEKKRLDGKSIAGEDVETYCILQRMDLYSEQLDDLFAGPFDQAANNPLYRNLFTGITTEEYTTYNADLTKLMDEMRVKFILGDESFDNWDKYVKEYIANGGLEVAQSMLDQYNEIYGKNDTLRTEY